MVSWSWLVSSLVALGLALLHVLGDRLHVPRKRPRLQWLSLAGGAAVAFVFLHLLPELAHHQQRLDQEAGLPLDDPGRHVWIMALFGIALFAGLERAVQARASDEAHAEPGIFGVHLAGYAVFNVSVAYLLLRVGEESAMEALVFGLALALHLAVNDFALREHHGRLYHLLGRWILVAAIAVGWGVGSLVSIPDLGFAILYAFVGGALLLNVLKEELPAERESRFGWFLLGMVGFGGLLMVTM